MVAEGFGRGWFDPDGRPHVHEADPILSMTSDDSLNFFAFQLLHCFSETCLIYRPTMKRYELRQNFMRFGSSCMFLFSHHQCIYAYESFEHCVSIL